MKCKKCGGEVNKWDKVCKHCGHNLLLFNNDSKNNSEKKESNTKKNDKPLKIILLLAVFVGVYGGHNFYLGNYKRAISQLILTLINFEFITVIWVICEVVLLVKKSKEKLY